MFARSSQYVIHREQGMTIEIRWCRLIEAAHLDQATSTCCGRSILERHFQFHPGVIDVRYKLTIWALLKMDQAISLHRSQGSGQVGCRSSRPFRQFVEGLRAGLQDEFEQIPVLVGKHLRQRA